MTAPAHPAASTSSLAADFVSFRAGGGALLENHARFEALHAASLATNPSAWSWTEWPKGWRSPESTEVRAFAEHYRTDVTFHCFLQWIADRSIEMAQNAALRAGMRVGLIADLAVGMSRAGSHAWSAQNDILMVVEIGRRRSLQRQRTKLGPDSVLAAGISKRWFCAFRSNITRRPEKYGWASHRPRDGIVALVGDPGRCPTDSRCLPELSAGRSNAVDCA